MLFQWEMGHRAPAEVIEGFWKAARSEKKTRDFANQLFEGAVAETEEIDALLANHAKNWRVERMAMIDRAILRLAVYELREGKTPDKVIINEAIELAKKYSSADAAPFVNGVLDAIHKAEASADPRN